MVMGMGPGELPTFSGSSGYAELSQRIGVVTIGMQALERTPAAVQAIYAHIIPTRVEYLAHTQSFEIVAMSALFEQRSVGEALPEYSLVVSMDSHDGTARKVDAVRNAGAGALLATQAQPIVRI